VNAAFLLVTTAWFAGADAAPIKPAEKMPAPAAAAVVDGGCCGGGCGTSDCGCEKEGFLAKCRNKMKGLFNRNKCGCEAAPSCGSCAPAPAACGSCGSSCGSCDSCESFGDKLRGKLKGLFGRKHCGCDSGCDSGCGASYGPAAPAGEKMPAPKTADPGKKMPTGVEPPFKPVGLERAPAVIPNVTVESEKSPY
jgi:hypothetical protein